MCQRQHRGEMVLDQFCLLCGRFVHVFSRTFCLVVTLPGLRICRTYSDEGYEIGRRLFFLVRDRQVSRQICSRRTFDSLANTGHSSRRCAESEW